MISKPFILFLSLCICSSVAFSKQNPWNWTTEQHNNQRQERLDETYYFIHTFSSLPAFYRGACGKGDQILLNNQSHQLIRNTSIKKIIENKLKSREEFTAMVFNINSKDIDMNVVDQAFIKAYCSSKSKISSSLYLDGFEIDIQNASEFRKVYIIEKVRLKTEN